MLADSHPRKWDEARRRLAIVRRYLRQPDRSAAMAEQYARQAGIGRSLFYRLARTYAGSPRESRTVAPAEDAASKKDAASTEDVKPTVNIMARAVEAAGHSASPAQIYRTAAELSRADGLTPPSRKWVRTHVANMLAGGSIAERMRLNADFAIDRAVLDLDVRSGTGPSEAAQLVCVVDLRRGAIVRHRLSAGEPGTEQVAHIADCDDIASGRIALSESDPVLCSDPMRSAIAGSSGRLVVGRWHVGAAIRAVVGLRIGRVALLARVPGSAGRREPVVFDTACQVMDELLLPYAVRD